MKPWEIWNYSFPGAGEHPAVIISHALRAERKQVVEVLLCVSQRGEAKPAPQEVVLNSEDGLDWQTFCRCDLIYSVPREDLRYFQMKQPARRPQKHCYEHPDIPA